MSTLTAARAQMAMSLMFHIIFAAVGIGMPLLLVVVERVYVRTGNAVYLKLARKWAKAVGLLFAVGAVSGTALSFELGLLWPRYMQLTGAAVGHVFALEGYVFFIEAIFIGLYLYGWERLSPKAHWWCGVVIAASGAVSGIFILAVNFWMQQPLLDSAGKLITDEPLRSMWRFGWFAMAAHSTLACYSAVGFAVAAVYAWGWLRGRRDEYARAAMLAALAIGGISAILQPVAGDQLGKFVFQTQKAKFAAMEGQFHTQRHAPLRIGGIPDVAEERTKYDIEIPGGLSVLAGYNPNTRVPGLDEVPRSDWPNVDAVHLSFQTMVGIGTLLVLVTIWFWGRYARGGERAMDSRALLWALVICGPLGFIALEAGWMVTELGRQPWAINGVLRTADAVTPAESIRPIFFAFSLLYLGLAVTVVVFLLKLMRSPEGAVYAPQEVD